MRRNNAMLLLILLLVLIIVAASIFILRGTPSGKDGSPAKTDVTPAPPRETSAPSPADPGTQPGTEPGTSPTPAETPEPTPSPTPEPTPAPTPSPTPEPTPADAKGSFSSDTGTGLNLRVDWRTVTAGAGERKLQVDVSIVSYSIYASAQYRSITLRIGEKSWSADCPAVSYDGKDQIKTTVASFETDAPAPGTQIAVEWAYGGTYSGKELKLITARGTVQ